MTPARRRMAIALVALVALVAGLSVVYAPAARGPYLWDDHTLVEAAETHPRPLASLLVTPYFTADPLVDGARPPYFRPLTALSLRADGALFGPGPSGHHVVNVALHALAAALLVVVARRLGAGAVAAVLGGVAWSLAPRLTEAVAWISGRPELLAGALSLAALATWPWLPGADASRTPWPRAGASLALLFGALLSKEIGVAAALALVTATLLAAGSRVDRGRRLGALAVPLVAYGVLRTVALAHVSRPPPASPVSLGTTLETTGRYVAMVLDPWHPATSIGLVGELDVRHAVLGAAALAIGAALALVGWRRRATVSRPLLVAAVLGLAALAPVLRLVPLGLASAVAADRLLYLPLAGLVLALAVLASRLPFRVQLPAASVAGALALGFAAVSRERSAVYADELRFWLTAAEDAHPRNTSPRSQLAATVRELGVPEKACALHASSVRTLIASGSTGTPRHVRALENLASCEAFVGRLEEAGAHYRSVIALRPEAGRGSMGLGFAALQALSFDEAEASFRRALALEPGLAPAREALAQLPATRLAAGRLATDDARRADPFGWLRLALRLGRRGDAARAWLAIAEDAAASPGTVSEAVLGLVALDDVANARRVLAHASGAPLAVTEKLAHAEARHARVDAVAARLDALGAR